MRLGAPSDEILGGLRDWIGGNNSAIMAVLALVIGARLLGDGIAAL